MVRGDDDDAGEEYVPKNSHTPIFITIIFWLFDTICVVCISIDVLTISNDKRLNLFYFCLTGNFRESEDNVIRFPEIEGVILEQVIQYLHYKKQHMRSTGIIPEFKIEPEMALELLMAANYLQC